MPLVESERRKSSFIAALSGYPVAAAFGLAAFRVGAWTIFQNGPGFTDGGIPFFAHVVQALVMVAIVVVDRKVAYSEQSFVRALGVAAAVGTLATLLVLSPVSVVAYVGSAFHGAASAFVMVGAGVYFCSLKPNQSCVALSLAFALYGIATWTLSFVPAAAIIAVSLACYPIAFFCLYLGIAKGKPLGGSRPPIDSVHTGSIPWNMLVLLGLCTLASMMARVLVPMTEELLLSAYKMYWPMILLCIFALCFVWIVVLKKNAETIWPLFMMIILSGFLCFSSFSRDDPLFAASFFRATRECLMLFCWVVIAGTASKNDLPRLPYFAITTLILLSGPVIATSAAGFLLPARTFQVPDSGAVIATTIMSFILIAATIAVSLSWTASTRSARRLGEDNSSVADAWEDTLDSVALEYGLTHREREVAALFVKGYTVPHAAEALCISVDTVRTHSKSLYRKLGIHKKRELIALVEGEGKEGEA